MEATDQYKGMTKEQIKKLKKKEKKKRLKQNKRQRDDEPEESDLADQEEMVTDQIPDNIKSK